jgi:hypothetical protein
MTDEAFWKRLETDVLPHVKKVDRRHFLEKVSKLKQFNGDEKVSIDLIEKVSPMIRGMMAQHEWMDMACMLRNFYWEGHQVKSLIDHCAVKGGTDPNSVAL